MNRNLLILGAGIYGMIAKEIAENMGCFNKISFIDDSNTKTPANDPVIGTTNDLSDLSDEYEYVAIAIGNAEIRADIARRIEADPKLKLATLISPRAYVSPSAMIGEGCIIEPMAVISFGAVLGKCTLVCAGAVINHGCVCGDIVQIDCNSTVTGYSTVPDKTKIPAGVVFVGE